MKKALTTYDVAKCCDVDPRTVSQWVKEGKIIAYRTPGGHSRIKVENFLKFLKEFNIPIPQEFENIVTVSANKKILVVDDDKNMLRSIERVLKLNGQYDLEFAADGFDAGRKIILFRPDIVILDIRMPGMDGYEVAQRIKESPETSQVKIIAISAFFEEEGKEKIISLGAEACLDKPFSGDVLLQEIERILG